MATTPAQKTAAEPGLKRSLSVWQTHNPARASPRAILGVAVFGGIYFVVVTAAEMMGFGASAKGVAAFTSSPSLLGDLGSSYVGSWVGNVITAGTTVPAFGCCLACTVGAARRFYAMSRDTFGVGRGASRTSRWGTPAVAAGIVTVCAAVIFAVYVAVSASTSYPYPAGDGHWFPIVAGAWLAVAIVGVLLAPRTARKLGQALAAREGIRTEEDVIGL
jgi:Amino acid permease